MTTFLSRSFQCKCVLLCGTCDLPARAMACCMHQYNGKYSCIKCEQPGESLKVGQRGRVQVFLPVSADELDKLKAPSRTDEDVKQCAKTSLENGMTEPVKGIKGPSYLSEIPAYSFVHGTSIDYMHCILLGISKSLLNLWFSSDFKTEPFSLIGVSQLVNDRLLSVKPPNNITRLPRSIEDRQHWKASEHRNWLLFYAVPVLKGLLPEECLEHLQCLSTGLFLLLKDSISHAEIDLAEKLFCHFYLMFSHIYGSRWVTLNTHQIIHFPDNVRDMGPLWCFSCFPFENANGDLLQLYNGTQFVDRQILDALSIMQRLPVLQQSVFRKGSPAYDLAKQICGKPDYEQDVCIGPNIYKVGGSKTVELSSEELDAVTKSLGYRPTRVVRFGYFKISLKPVVFS